MWAGVYQCLQTSGGNKSERNEGRVCGLPPPRLGRFTMRGRPYSTIDAALEAEVMPLVTRVKELTQHKKFMRNSTQVPDGPPGKVRAELARPLDTGFYSPGFKQAKMRERNQLGYM